MKYLFIAILFISSYVIAQKSVYLSYEFDTILEYEVYHKESKKITTRYFIINKNDDATFGEVVEERGHRYFVMHDGNTILGYDIANTLELIQADTINLIPSTLESTGKGIIIVGKFSYKVNVKQSKKNPETATYKVKTYVQPKGGSKVLYSKERFVISYNKEQVPLKLFFPKLFDITKYNGGAALGLVLEIEKWDDYARENVVMTFKSIKQQKRIVHVTGHE